MKFDHYVKRVEESPEYKKFREQHKKAELCAGFFVLDYEQGKPIHQIDFIIPGKKKIATFTIQDGVKMQISPLMRGAKEMEKMPGEVKIDIDELKGIVEDEMKNRTVTNTIKKIIAVIQYQDGKKIWKLSCITDGMGIIKAHIDDDNESILEFEKASLMDFMKMIPKDMVKQPEEKK